jgi:transcriptional regulator of acetoin/glycerol metabolism
MQQDHATRAGHRLPDYAVAHNLADAGDISRSWQRCRQAGLAPERRIEGPHYSHTELRAAADRRATLVTQSRPVIDYIYGQIRDSGCILLLSDENGFLLDSLGDTDFGNRAAQVALKPGACWAEDQRGTNAVGTALIEAKPIVVNGAEHYLRHNGFLACAAAPLVEPNGNLLGVIDISCDSRVYHPHTFGLVRAAAQMIENRIFEINFKDLTKLRFHISSACLGSVMEGALAIAEDGKILGANRNGFALLNLKGAEIGHLTVPEIFGISLRDLFDQDRHAQGTPLRLTVPKRGQVFITLDQMRLPSLRPFAAPVPGTAPDRLAALDTGDERIRHAIAQARRVLAKPVPILLQGETGTGKDVFARAIHAAGPRAKAPFISVNCAALPETLIESELFGYTPGAFTGARREGAPGRIREAHGGTLFLDEIGDMPVQMQTRLLQVLENREVTPLGGKPQKVDFALISATHCDLAARIETKQFRADLFYRLNGLAIRLPALRDRSDLPALITAILATEAAARANPTPLRLSESLSEAFAVHHWPGNLRQLTSTLRTACMMLEDSESVIDWPHLSETARAELQSKPAAPAIATAGSLRAHSDAVIAQAVAAANGNIAAAARTLRISRNTLYRRLNAGAA